MIGVSESNRLPIKYWVSDLEEGALKQAINLANLPFAFKHIALMPDCHQGYGMPIGGVMSTTPDVVVPNAVGVDIGCGMCAIRTGLVGLNQTVLKSIMSKVREAIPVGFKKHKEFQDLNFMPDATVSGICGEEFLNARHQIGTLGQGNHFIEIQQDLSGYIWIMIHSGSRNLGFKVAKYYNELAVKLNAKWYSSVPKSHELAFLPTDSPEGGAYLSEMQYCVEFALANRKLMMERVIDIVKSLCGNNIFKMAGNPDGIQPGEIINIAHNYAVMENHFGKNVMVHRKGATLARKDTIGIIPGSQGTNSFIVKGKGNPDSFNSCSHGAGRRMGRKQAIRELDLADEIAKLEKQGIVHSIRSAKDLDEAPGSYKDINEVMDNQKDLVEIVHTLKPLAVIKG